jgi:hypothetical protein
MYMMGVRRHLWENDDKVDRTAFRKGGSGLVSPALGQRLVMTSCENCNKLSISIQCSEFINYLWNNLLIENNFLLWIY